MAARFMFMVLARPIDNPGVPDPGHIEVGDAVLPESFGLLPGGYQFDVYRVIKNGDTFSALTTFRNNFEQHDVTGDTWMEVIGEMDAICEAVHAAYTNV